MEVENGPESHNYPKLERDMGAVYPLDEERLLLNGVDNYWQDRSTERTTPESISAPEDSMWSTSSPESSELPELLPALGLRGWRRRRRRSPTSSSPASPASTSSPTSDVPTSPASPATSNSPTSPKSPRMAPELSIEAIITKLSASRDGSKKRAYNEEGTDELSEELASQSPSSDAESAYFGDDSDTSHQLVSYCVGWRSGGDGGSSGAELGSALSDDLTEDELFGSSTGLSSAVGDDSDSAVRRSRPRTRKLRSACVLPSSVAKVASPNGDDHNYSLASRSASPEPDTGDPPRSPARSRRHLWRAVRLPARHRPRAAHAQRW